MDSNQITTKADRVRGWLRKCWTTRGLIRIGVLAFVALLADLIVLGIFFRRYDSAMVVISTTLFGFVVWLCAIIVTARCALSVAFGLFVILPQKLFALALNPWRDTARSSSHFKSRASRGGGTGYSSNNGADPQNAHHDSGLLEGLEITAFGDKFPRKVFHWGATMWLLALFGFYKPIYEPMISRGIHDAECEPAIADIRTKTTLYYFENNRLPGAGYVCLRRRVPRRSEGPQPLLHPTDGGVDVRGFRRLRAGDGENAGVRVGMTLDGRRWPSRRA